MDGLALGVGGQGPVVVDLVDALLGDLFAVTLDFHVNVLEVLALHAVSHHVTEGGVGVDQLQELQSLQGMGGGGGDAGHGAKGRLGGQHGLVVGGNHDLGTAAVAPAAGGGGPALGNAHAAHAGGFTGGGGVGVDEAVLHPLLDNLELIQDVGLLVDGNDLVGAVAVADAQGGQADAHAVIAVLGDGGDAVLVQQHGGLAGAVLQSLEGGGSLLGGMHVGPVGIVCLHLLLGPDKELLGGVILVGGDAVDLAVDLGGVKEVGGNGLGNAGGLGQQVGQIGESAHPHVVDIGAGVGEHDVIGLVGLDDDAAALAPVAPGDALDVDVHADLLLQVGVGLLGPGVDIGGCAAAHLVPGDGGVLAIVGVGGGVGVRVGGGVRVRRGVAAAAAAGQQGQRHDGSKQQCKKFLHSNSSSLFFVCCILSNGKSHLIQVIQGTGRHPFTAPTVRPEIKYFWKKG